MYEITIVNNALQISFNGKLIIVPKRLVWYDENELVENDAIRLKWIDQAHSHLYEHFPKMPLSQTDQGGAIPFSQSDWRTFATTNFV